METMEKTFGNVVFYAGLIISVFGGIFLDVEGKAYDMIMCVLFFGLALSVLGVAYEYRKAKQIQRNRERRAYQRMLERERKQA